MKSDGKGCEKISVLPGIEIEYFCIDDAGDAIARSMPENALHVCYCRRGSAVWKSGKGERHGIEPGDFVVCVGNGASAELTFPTGEYSGVLISADISAAEVKLTEPEEKERLLRKAFESNFGGNGKAVLYSGSSQTEALFAALYEAEHSLFQAYRRIKILELLLYLAETPCTAEKNSDEYRVEQVEAVRSIHSYLLTHIDKRITIESLARQYHMNATTLKAAFKSVYGNSIAAHIKEHRMEQAARLLIGSDMSIAQIAQAVGYDSQSKFTAAFKGFFGVLPRDYRKKNTLEPDVEEETI